MAKSSRKPSAGDLEGYYVFKAAARAKDKGPRPASEAPPAPAPPPGRSEPTVKGHFRSTAMPTKHEVVCHQCGREFQITGKTTHTFCPQCRTRLEFKEVDIEGEWLQPVLTSGRVRIGPRAVLPDADIVANDIVVEGRVEKGRLRATRELHLHRADALGEEAVLTARDLFLHAGVDLKLGEAYTATNYTVGGSVEGNLTTGGRVHIEAAGGFRGALACPHLSVDEGGGLVGTVKIVPPPPPAPKPDPAPAPKPAPTKPTAAKRRRRGP